MNINHNGYANYSFKCFTSLFVQSVKIAYIDVNFKFNFNNTSKKSIYRCSFNGYRNSQQ